MSQPGTIFDVYQKVDRPMFEFLENTPGDIDDPDEFQRRVQKSKEPKTSMRPCVFCPSKANNVHDLDKVNICLMATFQSLDYKDLADMFKRFVLPVLISKYHEPSAIPRSAYETRDAQTRMGNSDTMHL
jgi:hypothetical protein